MLSATSPIFTGCLRCAVSTGELTVREAIGGERHHDINTRLITTLRSSISEVGPHQERRLLSLTLRSMQALCAKSTVLRLPSSFFALDFDTHSATSHSEVSLSKLWRDAPLCPANNSSTDLDDQCLVHEAVIFAQPCGLSAPLPAGSTRLHLPVQPQGRSPTTQIFSLDGLNLLEPDSELWRGQEDCTSEKSSLLGLRQDLEQELTQQQEGSKQSHCFDGMWELAQQQQQLFQEQQAKTMMWVLQQKLAPPPEDPANYGATELAGQRCPPASRPASPGATSRPVAAAPHFPLCLNLVLAQDPALPTPLPSSPPPSDHSPTPALGLALARPHPCDRNSAPALAAHTLVACPCAACLQAALGACTAGHADRPPPSPGLPGCESLSTPLLCLPPGALMQPPGRSCTPLPSCC
ncbi:hypothetical protein V8C86DRAFT_2525706 [Haematococcus lacustris]